MFSKKPEPKRMPTLLAMGLGALAAVGAITIKCKGGEILSAAKTKMCSMLKKKEKAPVVNCAADAMDDMADAMNCEI